MAGKDENFDFSDERNVDCLSCHDNTGEYKKSPTAAGMPDETVDLLKIAQNVGPTTRASCGSCHFYGGGGANIKHGELEPALINDHPDADVHMGQNDMNCSQCHEAEGHQIKGVAISLNSDTREKEVECESCHGDAPHDTKFLNSHYQRVACQTCHIPVYAKHQPTKIYWDWSTAGRELTAEQDENGMSDFDKKKGSFVWAKDIRPEYFWYNGTAGRYLLGDKLEMQGVNHLNPPMGAKNDRKSKIYPFKVHRGKQIADAKFNYLIVPKLFGGFWKHFAWDKAADEGMKSVDLPYSGKFTFVETDMHWRVNHEVSPAENALNCTDCHGADSRMKWAALGYKKDPAPKKFMESYLKKQKTE